MSEWIMIAIMSVAVTFADGHSVEEDVELRWRGFESRETCEMQGAMWAQSKYAENAMKEMQLRATITDQNYTHRCVNAAVEK